MHVLSISAAASILRRTKKRRHERSSCSCREASDANYFLLEEDGENRLNQWNEYSIA
jgi:hypothetical protein